MVLNTLGSKLDMNTDAPTKMLFQHKLFAFISHWVINCTGRRYCSVGLMVSVLRVTLWEKKAYIPLKQRQQLKYCSQVEAWKTTGNIHAQKLMMLCFCGPQASWEYTQEDDWCQHPGTESRLSWPPPNLITHAHFSIISTAASAPHSKLARGLIGCKINPEGKEKDKAGGSFVSTHRAATHNQCCWTAGCSLGGALSCLVSKGFAPWCYKLDTALPPSPF